MILDIDETLLNPFPRWVTRVNVALGLRYSVEEVIHAGGWDRLLDGSEEWAQYSALADALRASEAFNSGLPTMEAALEGVGCLLDLADCRIACYLTTRPQSLAKVSTTELRRVGFPEAPVITRPNSRSRADTTEWKYGIIKSIAFDGGGPTLVIDDSLDLSCELLARRPRVGRLIVGLHLGPLTVADAKRLGIRSAPDSDFFVGSWAPLAESLSRHLGVLS